MMPASLKRFLDHLFADLRTLLAIDNGKFQIISAEYYSQDAKPYLYKRLVKVDTTTGAAWLLHSSRGDRGEIRQWLPLTGK